MQRSCMQIIRLDLHEKSSRSGARRLGRRCRYKMQTTSLFYCSRQVTTLIASFQVHLEKFASLCVCEFVLERIANQAVISALSCQAKMLSSKLLVWIIVCCCFLARNVDAGCVCNLPGTDYCQSCTERRIVRPKQKLCDSPGVNLPPIGDNCWCSKLLIEPAALPKPCPKMKPPPASCNCNHPPPSYAPPVYYPNYATHTVDDSPPADPISVSLAIQAGKTIGVPEAKLAYGFVQKPVDDLKKIVFSTVPEENLFKLKNEVITLKKRPAVAKPEEEEFYEVEDEEEELPADDETPPSLTYKQLGYVTEHFKNPRFWKVPHSYVLNDHDSYVSYSHDCGYRPGRIAARGKICKANECYENY